MIVAMFRKGGKADKRMRKLMLKVRTPEAAENAGVLLPVRHPLISPHIRREIALGNYERKEIEIVERRLEADDVVMEIGAGIGFLSAWCAKRVGDGRVFAYEANPALMDVIARTYELNAVAPEARNVLLGRGAGEREFNVEPEFWASSLQTKSAQAKVVRVAQVDLNAEIARIRPTFMVVDIEGGERELFEYACLDGVRKVCVEVHPHVIGNGGIRAMLERLFAQGFVLDFNLVRKNVIFLYREAAAVPAPAAAQGCAP